MFTHTWITLCPLCWCVAFAWLPRSLSWNWNEKQLSFGWIVFGYLTNAIQTPYLCSITIGMVVCIYKRTMDLLNKILKNHLPLERNTWNDCSSCDIGNVFWHLPIRTWQNSRITIDFCLLSFLIAAVFVSCCASSLSKHLYLDRKNHLRLYQWTLWTVSSGSWFFSFWNPKILLLSQVCATRGGYWCLEEAVES